MSSGKRLTEGDPEELIVCPIDPVHLLRRKRMPYHIQLCAKNNNMKDFTYCSFNYRHIIPRDEMQAHLEVCEDRCVVEREILLSQQSIGEVSGLKGYTGIPVSTFQPPAPEESWDDSNVVVDIAPNQGYSKKLQPVSLEPPRVKDPPNPRLPAMSGVSGSEVFKLATTDVGGGSPPRDKPRGRGRGRGTVPSPPKVDTAGGSPSRPVGRGRGILTQPADEAKEAARKKERKLKKMWRQIEELEKSKESLNTEQMMKLSRKEDVLLMLAQVRQEV